MVLGGRHHGDPLKSVIMLELWQFLENHIFEKGRIVDEMVSDRSKLAENL